MEIKYSELVAWALSHDEEWARINGLVHEARAKEHSIKDKELWDLAKTCLTDEFLIQVQDTILVINLPYSPPLAILLDNMSEEDICDTIRAKALDYLSNIFLK